MDFHAIDVLQMGWFPDEQTFAQSSKSSSVVWLNFIRIFITCFTTTDISDKVQLEKGSKGFLFRMQPCFTELECNLVIQNQTEALLYRKRNLVVQNQNATLLNRSFILRLNVNEVLMDLEKQSQFWDLKQFIII